MDSFVCFPIRRANYLTYTKGSKTLCTHLYISNNIIFIHVTVQVVLLYMARLKNDLPRFDNFLRRTRQIEIQVIKKKKKRSTIHDFGGGNMTQVH